jgi:hypothetical protein
MYQKKETGEKQYERKKGWDISWASTIMTRTWWKTRMDEISDAIDRDRKEK